MCGIVGYSGHRRASDVLMDGLKRLEYRGYDSAGIAMVVDGRLVLLKRQGELEMLQKVLPRFEGRTGIGHTRWATCGRPSDRNAHPFVSCDGKLAIVHNGIIENYSALRERLEAERASLHLRDGHRGGGASHGNALRWRSAPGPGRHGPGDPGHLCHRRGAGGKPGDRRRPQGESAGGRPGGWRRTSWPRMSRPCSAIH
jgi:hypothetical protein